MSDMEIRERVLALEIKVDHLTEKIVSSEKKLDEMHAVLMQARGARWALLAMAAVGGFLAGTLPKIWPIFRP